MERQMYNTHVYLHIYVYTYTAASAQVRSAQVALNTSVHPSFLPRGKHWRRRRFLSILDTTVHKIECNKACAVFFYTTYRML